MFLLEKVVTEKRQLPWFLALFFGSKESRIRKAGGLRPDWHNSPIQSLHSSRLVHDNHWTANSPEPAGEWFSSVRIWIALEKWHQSTYHNFLVQSLFSLGPSATSTALARVKCSNRRPLSKIWVWSDGFGVNFTITFISLEWKFIFQWRLYCCFLSSMSRVTNISSISWIGQMYWTQVELPAFVLDSFTQPHYCQRFSNGPSWLDGRIST